MKRLLVLALVLVAAPLAWPAPPLASRLPAGVPDGAALGWEKITGEVETSTELVVYTFYVNPARPLIYELTRYRMTRFGLVGGRRTTSPENEKFVWHARPGTGQLPLCFALQFDGTWRALRSSSQEYRNEMGTTMQVYGLHRRAVLER